MTGLADYSGASSSRQAYEAARKKALLSDPGSWPYSSYADWKKRNVIAKKSKNAIANIRPRTLINPTDDRIPAGL